MALLELIGKFLVFVSYMIPVVIFVVGAPILYKSCNEYDQRMTYNREVVEPARKKERAAQEAIIQKGLETRRAGIPEKLDNSPVVDLFYHGHHINGSTINPFFNSYYENKPLDFVPPVPDLPSGVSEYSIENRNPAAGQLIETRVMFFSNYVGFEERRLGRNLQAEEGYEPLVLGCSFASPKLFMNHIIGRFYWYRSKPSHLDDLLLTVPEKFILDKIKEPRQACLPSIQAGEEYP